jgi:hypothetical protein
MNSSFSIVKILSEPSFKAVVFPLIIITLTMMFKTISKFDPPTYPQKTRDFSWEGFFSGKDFNWDDVAIGFDLAIGSIFLLVTEAIDIARNNNSDGQIDKIFVLFIVAFFFAFIPLFPAILVRKFGWNYELGKLKAIGALIPIVFGMGLVWGAFRLLVWVR